MPGGSAHLVSDKINNQIKDNYFLLFDHFQEISKKNKRWSKDEKVALTEKGFHKWSQV